MECDAAGRNKARASSAGQKRQRERSQGDGMRVVRVQDVGPQVFDDARKLPCRVQVDLGARREANEIVSFGRATGELALGMRDEHRAMAPFAETEHGQQHLPLSASPRPCRVCVNGEHC